MDIDDTTGRHVAPTSWFTRSSLECPVSRCAAFLDGLYEEPVRRSVLSVPIDNALFSSLFFWLFFFFSPSDPFAYTYTYEVVDLILSTYPPVSFFSPCRLLNAFFSSSAPFHRYTFFYLVLENLWFLLLRAADSLMGNLNRPLSSRWEGRIYTFLWKLYAGFRTCFVLVVFW